MVEQYIRVLLPLLHFTHELVTHMLGDAVRLGLLNARGRDPQGLVVELVNARVAVLVLLRDTIVLAEHLALDDAVAIHDRRIGACAELEGRNCHQRILDVRRALERIVLRLANLQGHVHGALGRFLPVGTGLLVDLVFALDIRADGGQLLLVQHFGDVAGLLVLDQLFHQLGELRRPLGLVSLGGGIGHAINTPSRRTGRAAGAHRRPRPRQATP
jgi:hypothetical protein